MEKRATEQEQTAHTKGQLEYRKSEDLILRCVPPLKLLLLVISMSVHVFAGIKIGFHSNCICLKG